MNELEKCIYLVWVLDKTTSLTRAEIADTLNVTLKHIAYCLNRAYAVTGDLSQQKEHPELYDKLQTVTYSRKK